MTATPNDKSEARRNYAEWLGLLAGPIAWALNLQTNYILVQSATATGNVLPLYFTNLFFFAIAVSGGILSWRIAGRLKHESSDAPPKDLNRQRFLVHLGMLSSALFALIIVAQTIPVSMLNPAQK